MFLQIAFHKIKSATSAYPQKIITPTVDDTTSYPT